MSTTALRTENDWDDYLVRAGFRLERYGDGAYLGEGEPWYLRGALRVVVDDAEAPALSIYALDGHGATLWSATLAGVYRSRSWPTCWPLPTRP